MIKILLGLLLVYGAVGGMEHQPDYFVEQAAVAVLGLLLMWWGVRRLEQTSR